MEPISAIASAVLSTLGGKIAAATAVAAVTAAGAHGAGVVDLPLPTAEDKPAEVVTEDQPADQADAAKAAAEEKKAAAEEESDELVEGDLEDGEPADPEANDFGQDTAREAQAKGDDEPADPEANDFGQETAKAAREGGRDFGQARAAEGQANAPERPAAPEDVRQDGEAPRGDDAADVEEDEVEVEEESDDDSDLDDGSQAADNRPAGAGSQADAADRP